MPIKNILCHIRDIIRVFQQYYAASHDVASKHVAILS